jgi:hypothetical protein
MATTTMMYWTHSFLHNKQYDVELSKITPFMFTQKEKQLFPTVQQSFETEKQNKITVKTSQVTPIQNMGSRHHCNTGTEIDNKPVTVRQNPIKSPASKPAILVHNTALSLYDKCKLRAQCVNRCQDPLFWTIYLAKNGKREYDRIGGCTNGNVEMAEKNTIVEKLKSKSPKDWAYVLDTKWTKMGLYDLCNDLLTKPKMSWKHVYMLCAYYQCNIYWIDIKMRVYMTFLHKPDPDEVCDTFVLYKNGQKGPLYWVDTAQQVLKPHEIVEEYMQIINYDKPLKAASNYKVTDLEIMARQLQIEITGKIKKQDLYTKIIEKIVQESSGNV